ncbi:759_t:CDS:10 [Acaulospora morrowiae]|uniref:759_t:CDS:1 n=1 Tax=Acaulospora morrowiae TaxID=94023 RepID=A0A9N9BDY1_9GLOM|nr:759_t:CDS:10 [Acaulospora morrowiae]
MNKIQNAKSFARHKNFRFRNSNADHSTTCLRTFVFKPNLITYYYQVNRPVTSNPFKRLFSSSITSLDGNTPSSTKFKELIPKLDDLRKEELESLSRGYNFPKRTHHCGELTSSNVNERVILCGWAHKLRKLFSDLYFLPIHDSFGTTQLVYRPVTSKSTNKNDIERVLSKLSAESVICAEGIVQMRPDEMINKKMSTGEIEVEIDKLYCLNPAKKLPFLISDEKISNEEIRLKHRYIDLRRDSLQSNIRKRSLASWVIRDFLMSNGFIEVETPILFKSTPEGAREFIVPTRSEGLFYALTQSPQQYKQLLMAGGIDKYFQIAKCFRDEDLRTDRQPEFTQIDLEMSFTSVSEIMSLIERLMIEVWKKVVGIDIEDKTPFLRLSYRDVMNKFGSDKPDTRYDLKIENISLHLRHHLDYSDHIIECLVIKNGATSLTSSEIKSMKELANIHNHNPMLMVEANEPTVKPNFIRITPTNFSSWLSESTIFQQFVNSFGDYSSVQTNVFAQENVTKELRIDVGDLVILNKRKAEVSGSWTLLGRIRVACAQILQSKGILNIQPNQYNFLWVESFPLFTCEKNNDNISGDDHEKLVSTHHPFTSPVVEDLELILKDPQKVRGQHYDLILNGVEIGGGSIRIHSSALQNIIFNDILKMSDQQKRKFDHLINALEYGCPPHGGIALGFDRLMAIICNTTSIKDVIAFPKTSSGNDLLVASPSEITEEQLLEYKIKRA